MNYFHVFNFVSLIIVAFFSVYLLSLFLVFLCIDSLLYVLQHLPSADNLNEAIKKIKLFSAFLSYQQFAIVKDS